MKKRLVLLLSALLMISVGNAFAFPLYQGNGPLFPGTQFEDNNLDYFEDRDTDGLISVGDVLYSAVEFENVLDLVGGTPVYNLNTAADELVAWAVVKLDSIVGTTWNFAQDGTTAMIQVYSGGPTNLDLLTSGVDPTLAQAEAAIKDGTHLWDFSLTADTDTYWFFNPILAGANDPAVVAALASTSKVGSLNYALNQVWGNDIFNDVFADFANLALGGDGMVDLIGSGDILGGRGLTGGAFARSDIDVAINPVPEPATMILLGFGLVGLAVVRRKISK